MKLTVLCDNNTFIDNYLIGEPAYSVYIENGKDKILFDVGYSNVYKQNAKLLGIDLTKVNKIALSHGHDDHTKGIKYFPTKNHPKVYYAPHLFEERFDNELNISSPFTRDKMNKNFKMIEVPKPLEISKNLFFLGPIPRIFDFEKEKSGLERKINGVRLPDEFPDDSALCYVCDDGLVIITACSHSGICNICEYAKKLFNKKIKLIIGGFHLLCLSKKAKQTINYFKKQRGTKFYPCHCTDLHVKAEMIRKGLDVNNVGSGLTLEI